MQRSWESHSILVGVQNIIATQENSLTIPYEVKQIPFHLIIPLLDIYVREIKNMLTQICSY